MKAKTMRRALFMSVISLMLCVSMLIGTTFAWFTDEVKSGNNVIAAGNLDIELDYYNGTEWVTVQGADKLFSEELWEPGHTEVVYLKLSNKGSLALKYQLGINATETEGTNVEGKTFKLSDYIYMGVVEGINGETNAYTTREAAVAAVGDTGIISTGYSKPGSMEAKAADEYLAVVVYMPETVGNEANYLTGTAAPQITLGIELFATQIESEEDSFGPDYDGATPWVTAASIDWYLEDPNATEFTITSAEDLAGLAAIVNGTATSEMTTYVATAEPATIQDSFAGKTIKLGGDIDLAGHEWTPIGNWNNSFNGTFDGQGHTISNLYINDPAGEGVGLFGVVQNANLKGINIKNINVAGYSMVAGLVGAAYPANISDCQITGTVKIVADWAYVAGIAGYCYYGTQVDGCSVMAEDTGLIQSKNRNAVGGITAWLLEGDHKVTNCHVKNLDLIGWTNVGGITGFVHYNNTIDGCSVENVNLTKTRADGNPGIGLIAGGWSYSEANAITLSNNSAKKATLNGTHVPYAAYNVLYGSEYGGATTANFVLNNNVTEDITNNLIEAVTNSAELEAKIVAGETDIVLAAAGEYILPDAAKGKTLTISGTKDTIIAHQNEGEDGMDYALEGATVTFNGLTIKTTSGTYRGFARTAKMVYNNCNFVGAYALGAGTHQFNNCHFNLQNNYVWTWGGTEVVFDECVFEDENGVAKAILVHNTVATKVTVKNCEFKATTGAQTWDGIPVAAVSIDPNGANNAKVYLEGNNTVDTAFNGSWQIKYPDADGSYVNVYINGDDVVNTIKIGTLEELKAFANDVNVNGNGYSGKTVILTEDIDLNNEEWTPIGQTGGNGVATYFRGRFDGNGHTISNLKITNNAYDEGKNYAAGFFGFVDAGDANIVNLTIDGANVNGHHWTGVIAGYLTGNISDCTVKNATVTCTHANNDACGDKCGVIVGYVNSGSVADCTADTCTVTAGRDAGQIAGASKAVYVTGCTATNVTVTAGGDCTGANIRNEIIGRVL